jgi:hypothetical protein
VPKTPLGYWGQLLSPHFFTWPCDLISRSCDPRWPPPKKTLIFWCIKSSRLHKEKLYTYKSIIYCGICCFLMKKSSLGHYNYIFQIVWALLGGMELGWIPTVSLVSSKFVRRWRYHICNWISGVAQMPYASWDRIKCNNTWGISKTPYGSGDSNLGRIGYALRRQRVNEYQLLILFKIQVNNWQGGQWTIRSFWTAKEPEHVAAMFVMSWMVW